MSDTEREARDETPAGPAPDVLFEKFKAAAALVGAAAKDAEGWKDVTIHLENAFHHPLYQDSRTDFANALGHWLTTGIEIALED